MKLITIFFYLSLFALLSSCSNGRYQQKHDSIPTRVPNQAELKDATPRAEAYSRGGNKTYEVFGKSYDVLSHAEGFEQIGIASWYGKKFHGHYTSNGEIYDMYSMSAAHKSLPLPTYLKVTNLANNKTVVVRVNDRGPFYHDRIIDLSYSAAYKIDMLKTGTAEVKIEVITQFDNNAPSKINILESESNTDNDKNINQTSETQVLSKSIEPETAENIKNPTPYIQIFATSKQPYALKTANTLAQKYKEKTTTFKVAGVYRIQMGPIADAASLTAILKALQKDGYPHAFAKSRRN